LSIFIGEKTGWLAGWLAGWAKNGPKVLGHGILFKTISRYGLKRFKRQKPVKPMS
jgi:hypothetical protein